MFNAMTDEQTMIAPAERTDEQLLSSFRTGDGEAFGELFQRYERSLVGYLHSRCSDLDLSRDICQEAFLKLIDKPPRTLFGTRVKPWLFRVAGNHLIDVQRKRGRADESLPMAAVDRATEEDPFGCLRDSDDGLFARHLVDALPEAYSAVVRLHVFGEMTFKEVSATLGIPLGTALWRMQKALSLMRDYAKEMNYER